MSDPCYARSSGRAGEHPAIYALMVAVTSAFSTLSAIGKEPFAVSCGRHLAAAIDEATRNGRIVAVKRIGACE